MSANDRQVGGTHYRADYQHWDLVLKIRMGYLEACSTKYVTRWRKAEGLMDLEKGLHYLEKLIEVEEIPVRKLQLNAITKEVGEFVLANELNDAEHNYLQIMATFQNGNDLYIARKILEALIEEVQCSPYGPGTPEDGGHHSRQPPD